MPEKTIILIPQFNDWEALHLLIAQINRVVSPDTLSSASLLIVDDCSSVEQTVPFPAFGGQEIKVLRLYRNLGHQRAIAVGLSYISEETDCDKVVVMDADGEDAPADINILLEKSKQAPGRLIFAHRTKRSEGLLFRVFYFVYKIIFKLFTGKVINFGNFSVLPKEKVRNLVRVSEIWNNYPGGVIKSRLPYEGVPLERAKRLAGESKMNFFSLVLHGLSTISVLIDIAAVRILVASIVMSVGVGIVILFILFLKIAGNATPGWASTLSSTLMIVMLQALLLSLLLVFMVLQYRTQQHFIPALHYRDFIEKVETIS